MPQDLFKQNIVLIGPIPPPNGGMAGQAKLLLDSLRSDGVRVTFIATNAQLVPGWLNNVKMVRAILRLMILCVQCFKHINKHTVVHMLSNSGWSWTLNSVPVLLIAKRKRAHVIINYRGGGLEHFIQKNPNRFTKWIALASEVIVPSPFLQQVFAKYGIKANIINNIVHIAQNKSASDKYAQTKADSGVKTLLVTRNLEKIYGIDDVIQAFAIIHAQCPQTQLHIAGSGNQEAALKDRVKQLQLESSVVFLGRLPREEIDQRVSQAYCVLNGSYVDNMPNALVEAMSLGTVVCSSNAGGIPYIIEDNVNGILVNVGDIQAMAKAVINLLQSPMRCSELAARAQAQARSYSWDRVGKQWMAAYQRQVGA